MNENRYWPNRPLGRLVFVVAVVAAVASALLGRDYFAPSPAPGIPPQLTAGTLLPKPRALEPFQLTGVDGKPFTLEHLRGHWTFLAIGDTSCRDICPTTMATFRSLARSSCSSRSIRGVTRRSGSPKMSIVRHKTQRRWQRTSRPSRRAEQRDSDLGDQRRMKL